MRRKLLPLFLILLVVISIPLAHATTQYVGYNASNLGSSTCGSNCEGATDTLHGDGSSLQAPFAGQLIQVGIFTGSTLPTQVTIATFPAGSTPATTLRGCNGGNCPDVNAGQSFTVQDVEGLSGLGASAFNTITLASPVTVSSGQWVGVVFLGSGTGTNIMFCGASCPATAATANDLGINFGTANPVTGNSYNSYASSSGGIMVGGTFQTVASGGGGSPITQCYGNCGSPAVTLTNTNSTHITNFNSSITLFYQAQSNLNGFIRNETVNLAKNYNNGMRLFFGIYLVDPTCTNNGGTPFTPSCPGFLTAAGSNAFPGKGRNWMLTNIAIQNGQWFGIAVSGSFSGLDINDTNTSVNLFQASGITPAQIAQFTTIGPSKPAVYAFVRGNSVTVSSGPPGFTSGGGCITCGLNDFITALGGGVFGALIGFGIIFAIITGGLLYATRIHHPKSQGGGIKGYGVPMELLTLIFVIMLLAFSAAGVLPPYIPFLIIALVAFLFTQAIFSHRRGTRTEPV